MSEEKSSKSGAGRRGGKATDSVRKMRMSNAVSREVSLAGETTSASAETLERAEKTYTETSQEKRVRITVDASRDQHRRLKVFAIDADSDGMSVMRALLDELDDDPELANRIRERLAKSA